MPNLKKLEVNPNNALFSAIHEIEKNIKNSTENNEVEINKKSGLVDIITFCEHPELLNLNEENLKLWISQRVILKSYYMGTIGNEDLKLNKEEWDWLYAHESSEEKEEYIYEKNLKDVIKKLLEKEKGKNTSQYFKTLVLVLGRRASKTLISSIITAYEAYKLLAINNGDPHSYYNLPHDDEIAIINVALSQNQAGRLFSQVQARIRNSPFFKGRIAKDASSEIRLYTDLDLKKKKDGSNISVNGSILLLCGHSNPDSLAGYSTVLILFDEIAFFDESGKVTGSYFFNRLKPSLAKFFKYNSARIVMISSPNTKSGIFYDVFSQSKSDDGILAFQLPTWDMNPDIPYDNEELKKDRGNNPEMFATEYGAQWAHSGTLGNYFEEELIKRCIRNDLQPHNKAYSEYNYYLHIDPAKKNNNYSAVLVAKEYYIDNRGKKRNRIYLANVWVWKPVPGVGLLFNEIDKQVVQICRIFSPVLVTYDDYHSQQSIELLRSSGVNVAQISFNRSVKQKIYNNLKDLMTYQPEPELYLYDNGGDSTLLMAELKNLKFRRITRGISFLTDKHSDVNTDDTVDCLAGACMSANEGLRPSLPAPVSVYTGFR